MDFTKQKFITTKELAEILRVSPMTVYRLAKTATIPSYRVGKNFRFIWDEVAECLPRVYPENAPSSQDGVETQNLAELEQLAGMAAEDFSTESIS